MLLLLMLFAATTRHCDHQAAKSCTCILVASVMQVGQAEAARHSSGAGSTSGPGQQRQRAADAAGTHVSQGEGFAA